MFNDTKPYKQFNFFIIEVKPGQCPTLEQSQDGYCEEECRTDADCTLHLKCCSTGCGTSCVDPTPGQLITQQPQPAYTEGPIEAACKFHKICVCDVIQ